jgi:hypothetical protein
MLIANAAETLATILWSGLFTSHRELRVAVGELDCCVQADLAQITL